jgi:transcriptional regulator with XRE-family HTH domain
MRDTALREHIGMEVKIAMMRSGVSQEQFARVLGCAKSTLSSKLTGKVAFTTDELVPICEHLGLDIIDLFPQDERVSA